MGAKYTAAQKRAAEKYIRDKTDDIRLRMPAGTKAEWTAAAKSAGVSMTKYVADAVGRRIADDGKTSPEIMPGPLAETLDLWEK